MNDDTNLRNKVERQADRDHVIAKIANGFGDQLMAVDLDALFFLNAIDDVLRGN